MASLSESGRAILALNPEGIYLKRFILLLYLLEPGNVVAAGQDLDQPVIAPVAVLWDQLEPGRDLAGRPVEQGGHVGHGAVRPPDVADVLAN